MGTGAGLISLGLQAGASVGTVVTIRRTVILLTQSASVRRQEAQTF